MANFIRYITNDEEQIGFINLDHVVRAQFDEKTSTTTLWLSGENPHVFHGLFAAQLMRVMNQMKSEAGEIFSDILNQK